MRSWCILALSGRRDDEWPRVPSADNRSEARTARGNCGRPSGFGRWRGRAGRSIAAATVVLVGLAPASASAADPCIRSGGTVTCTFDYTGAPQTWTVPARVRKATFDVYGAEGGSSGPLFPQSPPSGGIGGPGGHTHAVLAVSPGQRYQINVGGVGQTNQGATGGQGGYNGGANGGSGMYNGGAGGGGASDVRTGFRVDCVVNYTCSLATRLLAAGGGGGGGGSHGGGGGGGYYGGGGGSGTGQLGSHGGGGGTQSAGGAGGRTNQCDLKINPGAQNGAPGRLGEGGSGGASGGCGGNPAFPGGAGGGTTGGDGASQDRYFGGGAGGGGGSGYAWQFASNVTLATNVQHGNGKVVVTYLDPAS